MPAKSKAKRKPKGRGSTLGLTKRQAAKAAKKDEEVVSSAHEDVEEQEAVEEQEEAVVEQQEPVEEQQELRVPPPAEAAAADPNQPKRKKRRTDISRSFKTIPEIMNHQDTLATWIEEHEFLYNSAHKSHKDKTKKEALYTDKANEIREVTADLSGKLSLFYYQICTYFCSTFGSQ